MADEQRALTLSIEDDIAIITFDTPNARANLMSESVVKEISEILRSLEDRTDLAGLIFRVVQSHYNEIVALTEYRM